MQMTRIYDSVQIAWDAAQAHGTDTEGQRLHSALKYAERVGSAPNPTDLEAGYADFDAWAICRLDGYLCSCQ